MVHDTEGKHTLKTSNLHIAEIASTPEKSKGGILIAGADQLNNKFLDSAIALYSKNYVIAGEGETPDVIRNRLAGNDPYCPEMKVMALLDDKQQVQGISFFEKYNIEGNTVWLNTYAITDDKFKENELVAKAFHEGAAAELHEADKKAGRENSLVVAEVNSTRGYNNEALHDNKEFADNEWTIKTGETAEAREAYQVSGAPKAINLSGNRVLIQAPYMPPNLEELPEDLKGASASDVAGFVANQAIIGAKAGENTGAEPLFPITYKTDGSQVTAHDIELVGKLLGKTLPTSVILGNSEEALPENVVKDVLDNHRKSAGYEDMDKAFSKIHKDLSPTMTLDPKNTNAHDILQEQGHKHGK